mgnify:FL=1
MAVRPEDPNSPTVGEALAQDLLGIALLGMVGVAASAPVSSATYSVPSVFCYTHALPDGSAMTTCQ